MYGKRRIPDVTRDAITSAAYWLTYAVPDRALAIIRLVSISEDRAQTGLVDINPLLVTWLYSRQLGHLPVTCPKCRFLAQASLLQTTARTRIRPQNANRCGQPGQQQGRRIPSLSCEHSLSTCCRLVSSFLTEMVQQIHSLRASGVMSSQAASAFASNASAFRRSAGRLCTTPPEI